MSYLIWLLIFAFLPTMLLWWKFYSLLSKHTITVFYCVLLALILEIPWDIFAVTHHIWYFPEGGSLGLRIGVLPIEEYLFMITVTAFIVTTAIIYKYKVK